MEEFLVAKFLSRLDFSFSSIEGHLLVNNNVPTLSNALSRVLHITTSNSESSSTIVSKHYVCLLMILVKRMARVKGVERNILKDHAYEQDG